MFVIVFFKLVFIENIAKPCKGNIIPQIRKERLHMNGRKGKERQQEREMAKKKERKKERKRGTRVDDCICYHQ